ncbi:MAG: hypothetical protein KDA88_10090 [Planctomycetaceae bacterium]|nr:hypothetical protein [Planctomycetaceae bacterium]MCB9952673.1 hypothetical protein [Planctomycetaceae bacterium]
MPKLLKSLLPLAVLALVLSTQTISADDAAPEAKSTEEPEVEEEEPGEDVPRVSLEVAQDRARIMHDVYISSMEAMHHRYFHGDRAVIPARAMEDVFRDMEHLHNYKSHWISASFSPMSLDHKPKTEFEKLAARKLAKGDEYVETIESGYYRRAGSVPLSSGCISCHSGLFAATSASKKFAGLVISIPVSPEAVLKTETETVATE